MEPTMNKTTYLPTTAYHTKNKHLSPRPYDRSNEKNLETGRWNLVEYEKMECKRRIMGNRRSGRATETSYL